MANKNPEQNPNLEKKSSGFQNRGGPQFHSLQGPLQCVEFACAC